VSSTGARLGWVALCLVPLSVGFGRFWYLHIAPAEGIPYQYRSVALSPTDGLVVLTCVGWLAWSWRSGPGPRVPRGTGFVFAALALLALAAAASIRSAVDQLIALGLAAQLAVLVLFFLAASKLLASFPRRHVLTVAALAVVSQALLATWQAAAQTTAPAGLLFNGWATELTSHGQGASVVLLPIAGRWLRSYGSFPHPNILGGFLALSLAIIAITDDPRGRRLRAVALAAGFAALLLTFSRAAWLAVLLGAAAWLIATRGAPVALPRIRGRLAVALVLALLALVVLVRVGSLGSLSERNSIETRLFYDSLAWKVVARGIPVGAGNLVVAQQHLLGASSAGSEPAHDVFLIALAELGPLGLVAWLSILGSLLFAAWLRRADPGARAGPLVAAAVLAPLLLFDHYLWTQSTGRVLLVFTLTVLMSLGAAQGSDEERRTAGGELVISAAKV
jgi:O-antigen ligase